MDKEELCYFISPKGVIYSGNTHEDIIIDNQEIFKRLVPAEFINKIALYTEQVTEDIVQKGYIRIQIYKNDGFVYIEYAKKYNNTYSLIDDFLTKHKIDRAQLWTSEVLNDWIAFDYSFWLKCDGSIEKVINQKNRERKMNINPKKPFNLEFDHYVKPNLYLIIDGIQYFWDNVDDTEYFDWFYYMLKKKNTNKGNLLEKLEYRYGKGKRLRYASNPKKKTRYYYVGYNAIFLPIEDLKSAEEARDKLLQQGIKSAYVSTHKGYPELSFKNDFGAENINDVTKWLETKGILIANWEEEKFNSNPDLSNFKKGDIVYGHGKKFTVYKIETYTVVLEDDNGKIFRVNHAAANREFTKDEKLNSNPRQVTIHRIIFKLSLYHADGEEKIYVDENIYASTPGGKKHLCALRYWKPPVITPLYGHNQSLLFYKIPKEEFEKSEVVFDTLSPIPEHLKEKAMQEYKELYARLMKLYDTENVDEKLNANPKEKPVYKEMPLTSYVRFEENVRSSKDYRRKVNKLLVEYTDDKGHIYRRGYEFPVTTSEGQAMQDVPKILKGEFYE